MTIYGLEISLSNIVMIGLFRSNNRIIFFSKTEKFISQQTSKRPYIYDGSMERRYKWVEERRVLKFVRCLQILLFLNKGSIAVGAILRLLKYFLNINSIPSLSVNTSEYSGLTVNSNAPFCFDCMLCLDFFDPGVTSLSLKRLFKQFNFCIWI